MNKSQSKLYLTVQNRAIFYKDNSNTQWLVTPLFTKETLLGIYTNN